MSVISIITINFNNKTGLDRTLKSVACQLFKDFEHVIIDGASTDGSVDVITEYASKAPFQVKWVSEKDKGIYNAMNKGIMMATGEYIQILNSGDYLAASDVIETMVKATERFAFPYILLGNVTKVWENGKTLKNKNSFEGPLEMSFFNFYSGTVNPDGTFIKRSLFDRYGFFNENMKICSDWEWFVKSVAIGGEKVYHINKETVLFDMGGISESGGKNQMIIRQERQSVLESLLPASVLKDYDNFHRPICVYNRLRRRHLWGVVHLLERIVFKLEKWGILR